jgi:hypothetical protein
MVIREFIACLLGVAQGEWLIVLPTFRRILLASFRVEVNSACHSQNKLIKTRTRMALINPGITEKKKSPTFTELDTFCTHIFKIIFATFCFHGSINRPNCSQNGTFIQIFQF